MKETRASVISKMLPYTSMAAALVLVQVLWVVTSRYLANHETERVSARIRFYGDLADTGGTGVGILQFYASSGAVTEGESATICYGVRNARSVRIDPPVEELKPAMNRCFAIAPARTTTYTLVAEGLDGTQTSASFTVRVAQAPPSILFAAASDEEIWRGNHPAPAARTASGSRRKSDKVSSPSVVLHGAGRPGLGDCRTCSFAMFA